MKKYLLLFLLCIITSSSVYSQLSGSYTVGRPGDDFLNISDAIDSIQSQGMNSTVQLLMSNGAYSTIMISSLIPTGNNKLIIRSNSGIPDSVTFFNCQILNSENVTIKNIGFYKKYANGMHLVYINKGINIRFTGCRIIDSVTTNYNYGEATLTIDHAWNNPITTVYIDSCYISGLNGIAPYIIYEYTVSESGNNGKTYFTMDSIIGEWDIFNAYYRKFNRCYIKTFNGLYENGNRFDSCCFHLYSIGNGAKTRLIASYIRNSQIFGTKTLDLDLFGNMKNCILHLPVYMSHTQNAVLENNIFNESLQTTFGYGMKYNRNRFLAYVHLSYGDGAVASNNFFLDTLEIGFGSLRLVHNNFGYSSLLWNRGSSGIIKNNILYSCKGKAYLNIYERNNFISNDIRTYSISCFDPTPSYYDPQYTSLTDLHIHNPSLFSRARKISYVTTDIDGKIRDNNRSVGADEHCLSFPLPDTVFVECGRNYILKNCLDSITSQLQWKPGINMVDSTANNPIVIVDSTFLMFLKDTVGNIVDSMYLVPSKMKSFGKRTYYTGCGWPTPLAANVPAGSTISWSPDSLVNYPDSSHVMVSTDTTTQFIAIIDNGKCGIIIDTIDLIVDPTPSAMFSPDSFNCVNGYFSVSLLCYDSVLWDFGDGTFGSTPIIAHTFPHTGTFTVTLTVWHIGISATYHQNFLIWCVGLPEIQEEEITIYPNPANNILHLRMSESIIQEPYKIFDQTGRIVIQGLVKEKQTEINIHHLSNGVYFLNFDEKIFEFIKNSYFR